MLTKHRALGSSPTTETRQAEDQKVSTGYLYFFLSYPSLDLVSYKDKKLSGFTVFRVPGWRQEKRAGFTKGPGTVLKL